MINNKEKEVGRKNYIFRKEFKINKVKLEENKSLMF